MKEPHGLVRDDGKRPDGLTLLPRNSGRSATWDVTVVDTLGSAYLQQSASPGPVRLRLQLPERSANTAHSAWHTTYFQWLWKHLAPWVSALRSSWLKSEGVRPRWQTTDPRETTFLFRLSVAFQRFNAACLADCRHVPNFRVRTVTIPDTFYSFLDFSALGNWVLGAQKN